MKRILIILLNIHLTTNLSAQIFEDRKIDESKVSGWSAIDINEYEGIYFFGISEGESQINLAIADSIICLQVRNYEWVKVNNEHSDWRPMYKNYTNCRIVGNKFYSNETNGEFVIYKEGDKIIKGLKLENPPTGYNNQYEIGEITIKDKSEFIDGKYIRTKFDIISTAELEKHTAQELKVMRNEIFARYNAIFKKDGEMDKYFRSTKWYSGIYKDVNNLISEIEMVNIKNIKLIEDKKNNHG